MAVCLSSAASFIFGWLLGLPCLRKTDCPTVTGAPGQPAVYSLPSGVGEADRGGAGLENRRGGLSVCKSKHFLPTKLLFKGHVDKGIHQLQQQSTRFHMQVTIRREVCQSTFKEFLVLKMAKIQTHPKKLSDLVLNFTSHQP